MIPLKLKSNLELNHMHIPHFFFFFSPMDVTFFLKLMLENVVEEKLAFRETKTKD